VRINSSGACDRPRMRHGFNRFSSGNPRLELHPGGQPEVHDLRQSRERALLRPNTENAHWRAKAPHQGLMRCAGGGRRSTRAAGAHVTGRQFPMPVLGKARIPIWTSRSGGQAKASVTGNVQFGLVKGQMAAGIFSDLHALMVRGHADQPGWGRKASISVISLWGWASATAEKSQPIAAVSAHVATPGLGWPAAQE